VNEVRIACVQLQAREVDDAGRALEEALDAADRAAGDADLVLLPEATYPGYILHEGWRFDDEAYGRARAAFGDVARRRGAWIAVGLVRQLEDGLVNSAVLLNPDGGVAATADKRFLWHFDSRWFRVGKPGEVISLPWGPTGMFVCADARMTEIPRRLAVGGARVLLDSTALVLSPLGTNAQLEYMLAARAWENGAFLAVANKCGSEAGIVRYGGRSTIFDPWGARLGEAGPQDPEIVFAELDPDQAPGPRWGPDPGSFPELSAPIESLPITRVLAGPPPGTPLRLAMAREGVESTRPAKELNVDLVIGRRMTPMMDVLSVDGGSFRFGDLTYQSGDLVVCGAATVGLLAADGGVAPESVRSLMLRGASLVVFDRAGVDVPEFVLRTRADENRIFLVTLDSDDRWQIHAPTGASLGQGPTEGLDAVYVELLLALCWQKEMAPGTDIIRNRPGNGDSPREEGG
jgi:predicted amidohydrolase